MTQPRLLIMTLLALVLVGCAKSPTTRWYQAASVVAGVNDTVADLWEIGKLTDDDMYDLWPQLDTMNGALDRARERLPDGGDAFETMMDVVFASRDAIQAQVAREADNGN